MIAEMQARVLEQDMQVSNPGPMNQASRTPVNKHMICWTSATLQARPAVRVCTAVAALAAVIVHTPTEIAAVSN